MDAHDRQYSIDREFPANAEHVTLISVISASGKIWDPVVILQGTCQKYRIRQDGVCEIPHDFRPPCSMDSYRTRASIKIPIFEQWV